MLSLSNYQTSSSSAHELIQTLSLIGLPHPVDDGSGLINHPKALIAQHLISLMEGHSTTMPQLIQGLNAGIEVFSQVLVQKMCICSSKSIFKPNPTQYKKNIESNPRHWTCHSSGLLHASEYAQVWWCWSAWSWSARPLQTCNIDINIYIYTYKEIDIYNYIWIYMYPFACKKKCL